jgi:hypothetical protein
MSDHYTTQGTAVQSILEPALRRVVSSAAVGPIATLELSLADFGQVVRDGGVVEAADDEEHSEDAPRLAQ